MGCGRRCRRNETCVDGVCTLLAETETAGLDEAFDAEISSNVTSRLATSSDVSSDEKNTFVESGRVQKPTASDR